MRDKLDAGCSTIVKNCTYTAETRHIIAARKRGLSNRLQIVPAILAAVLAAGSVIVKDADLLRRLPDLPRGWSG